MSKKTDIKIASKAWAEEIHAGEQYSRHLKKAEDAKLKKILKHNQKDEYTDHAAKLACYIVDALPIYRTKKVRA